MKHTRICSLLLVLVTMFTMLAQFATPVSAIKLSETGMTMKSSQSYNKDKKYYTMKFTFNNPQDGIPFVQEAYAFAYLYNSSGKCVGSWTNKGNGFEIGEGETWRNFNIDPSKLSSGDYTFKIVLKVKYHSDFTSNTYSAQFSQKYNLNTFNMKPGIKFKKLTYLTREDGLVVPRVSVVCSNIKGEALTMRVYDEFDNCICTIEGPKRKTNNETGTFTWTGRDNGVQYPDGKYKVVVTSTNGYKISYTFNFDFPRTN